ncbi:uncharacterized protein MELLADRAFT_88740 [Melampsora larici-populina 98AG31]|uniref:Uncharacterized protein n=1 Tax=Melampsora larici-populina (strain 98AG31 / pathotype 3-4-7) TaxID=747676 RepID=F4RST6_MELLP|nr:uncharacterized protein MELLADRAFT_88740 [Melampsora larici-populina 98AG31]EGG04389.1 hypothetical protein MELLADRAFT_88740 [Melampsora larici-populina 98AG31]
MAHGKKTPRNWKQGAPVRSLKENNALVAASLPKANTPSCRALSGFIRNLLDYNCISKEYPAPPTPEEYAQLDNPTHEIIMEDQRLFHPGLDSSTSTEDKWAVTKALFSTDLQKYGALRFTFDWTLNKGTHWNRVMTSLLIKHWLNAKKQGLFSKSGINPSHMTESKAEGMVTRWIRGRAFDIQSGRNQPEKIRKVEKNKKKRVESSLRHLGQPALQLIPDADCCSETEWEPSEVEYEKIGLIWRSQQYEAFLHAVDWTVTVLKTSGLDLQQVDTLALFKRGISTSIHIIDWNWMLGIVLARWAFIRLESLLIKTAKLRMTAPEGLTRTATTEKPDGAEATTIMSLVIKEYNPQ